MSSTLRGSYLIDNCTPSISYDRQVQAASQAFDPQMWEIIDDTGQVVFIPNIMGLTDSNLVDILAWQFHVDFYDPTKNLEFRKQLVQLAIVWHKTKGTVDLVNQVLAMFYPGPPAPYITEWWQYFNPLPPNFPALQTDQVACTFIPANVDITNDIFNVVAGALTNGMVIYFQVGTIPPASGPPNALPAPIVAGTHYYVVNWKPTQFQISATLNGLPLGLTAAGSGTNEIWAFASAGGNWHNRYRFRVVIDNTVIPDTEVPAIINLIQYFKPITRWPEGETLLSQTSTGSVFVFGYDFMTVTIQSAAAPIRTPT
jgi:phage tail P2-like protein